MTETTKPGLRGEHEGNRNTIVQGMSDCFRRTCGDYARMLLSFAYEATGAALHPAFPAPSALRDEDFARLGRVSAAGMHGRVFSPEALCEGLSVEIILCHSGARVERASPESIVPRAREEKWIPGSRLRRAPE
jgi:hypothetical protein